MGHGTGLPALAVVAVLLVATATADDPSRPPDPALSAEGQTPEPPGPARLEASGESDLSTSAHLGKAVTSLAFPGSPLATEPRDPPRDPRDPPPGGDPGSESGSESAPNGGGDPQVPSPMSPPSPASPRRAGSETRTRRRRWRPRGSDVAAPGGFSRGTFPNLPRVPPGSPPP